MGCSSDWNDVLVEKKMCIDDERDPHATWTSTSTSSSGVLPSERIAVLLGGNQNNQNDDPDDDYTMLWPHTNL